MKVTCIIINYRSADLVCALLESISKLQCTLVDRVVIVDNASGDNSLYQLKSKIKELGMREWVHTFESGGNAGFGAGNNFGVTEAMACSQAPDVLWLLNPDTLIDQTDLEPALLWFQSDPTVAVVGTGMVDCDGEQDLAGHRDPSPIGEFVQNAGAFRVLIPWAVSDSSLDRPGPVDWVSGASLLVRADAFEQQRGFDEGFFLYFEEVDLCRRIRQAGWKVIYEPRSRIVHLEGKTTGVEKAKPMPKYWYDSRRRFFVKHYGICGLWAADLAWSIGQGIGMLRGRGPSACRGRDLWRSDLPFLLGQKRFNRSHVRG